ncbi:type II toxin-antitoxin system RelE/ParE family toxin [Zhihengliuella sp.]|uniref:type II toxin-antitoxin system RelE family toxin n=1 Tax=Zhihengliuella sp. TaxID=1954483 RepID=UPI002811A9B5|nr:type II toxin-antitoxin system RelE/ParE family toxin [Zhihengliuella sp.]
MNSNERKCRVRLTEDAVQDLHRLQRKDPEIVRKVFKKMLLLERSPQAGEPLLGNLLGFRKLVVGDRDWRIVWRETRDENHDPVLEIAEVWAAGVRADREIYDEMAQRVEALGRSGSPLAKPLAEVVEALGPLYREIHAQAEPSPHTNLPEWIVEGLKQTRHMTAEEIEGLGLEEAQQLLVEVWSRPNEGGE